MTLESLLNVAPMSWKVGQVIVLDWYDGPRSGLCRLTEPRVDLLFELLDERQTEDGLDDRLFSLSILAEGTFTAVLSSLAFAGTPPQPVWVPRWQSSNQADLEGANAAVQNAKALAVATSLVTRTSDFISFRGIWNLSALGKESDWFSFLGIDTTDPT